MFIETKAIYASGKKNTLSKEQKEFKSFADQMGYKTEVYYTFDQYEKIVKEYKKLPAAEIRS